MHTVKAFVTRQYENWPDKNTGACHMSKNENVHSEYKELVRIWRKVWDQWNEVMNRNALAFSNFESPPHKDLELAERLKEQVDSAWAKMKGFQAILINRQRGSDSP